MLCGKDEVAFIFAILVIDHQDALPVPDSLKGFFNPLKSIAKRRK